MLTHVCCEYKGCCHPKGEVNLIQVLDEFFVIEVGGWRVGDRRGSGGWRVGDRRGSVVCGWYEGCLC